MKKELESIRKRLDEIDRSILTALAERQGLVKEVSSYKLTTNTGIRDMEREERLLNKIRYTPKLGWIDIMLNIYFGK